MRMTVTEVLSAATDSVTLITDIKAKGGSSAHVKPDATQAEINDMVKRNVDHLSIILAYEPKNAEDDTPDVVGSSADKSSYTAAITTGNKYITDNS